MTNRRIRGRTHEWLGDLGEALSFPLTSDGRLAVAAATTLFTYVVLVLSTFPQFSIQVLTSEPADLFFAVATLTQETYASTGWLGLGLLTLYALLTGVAVANGVALVRRARRRSASTLAGIAPGLLAAGCASCGAGILGVLGFAGAMALLPFDGNLLRLAGIGLLVFVLGRTGDPRTCSIPRTAGS
ncbi:hypothetical protein [Natronosalvus rutilus]|uniref:Uncharacterized protein n=1 Tax=Natronosalvus rutilus TaxID=2953753 RepID=A0A9E7NB77_9EURY|nr:hypothetical protein [Natronosalvus rutilus]UTF55214.1 hypothetical protein NGM29_08185 [Natronosalvus rutilus]